MKGQVVNEMSRYNLVALGVQHDGFIRWSRFRVIVGEQTDIRKKKRDLQLRPCPHKATDPGDRTNARDGE